MNIREYVKSLIYEYRLSKSKAKLLEMKHNLRLIKRGN